MPRALEVELGDYVVEDVLRFPELGLKKLKTGTGGFEFDIFLFFFFGRGGGGEETEIGKCILTCWGGGGGGGDNVTLVRTSV